MSTKKTKLNPNGSLPKAKDFPPPERLTPELEELRDATREAMQALRDEIKKYGKKPDFRH
jgi:GH25 family lysozyme M1 (1,4-beta-N-acetylmuramidase)